MSWLKVGHHRTSAQGKVLIRDIQEADRDKASERRSSQTHYCKTDMSGQLVVQIGDEV